MLRIPFLRDYVIKNKCLVLKQLGNLLLQLFAG